MSDLVDNLEDRFYRDMAHLIMYSRENGVLHTDELDPSVDSRLSGQYHMSRVTRKPVCGIPDEVRHNPGCTATDIG